MPTDKTSFARQFIGSIPHSRELGMTITEVSDGKAEIAMGYDTRFVGDPETGVIHGGAVSALMDTCCGTAVMSHPQVGGGHPQETARSPQVTSGQRLERPAARLASPLLKGVPEGARAARAMPSRAFRPSHPRTVSCSNHRTCYAQIICFFFSTLGTS